MKNTKKEFLVNCPHCAGSGKIELPLDLQEVVMTIKVLNGSASPRSIWEYLETMGTQVGYTSIHGRLRRLVEKYGIVERKLKGREYIYSLK